MNFQKIRNGSALLVLICATFLSASCSQKKTPSKTTEPGFLDLGVLELSNKQQSRHELGGGKTAVITPTRLPNGKLLVQMFIETSDANGRKRPVGISSAFVQANHAVKLSVREVHIKFTPKLRNK
jgi:hypothetical protein